MWCPIIHEWGQPNIKVTSMKVTFVTEIMVIPISRRLPFGLVVSQDICQLKIDRILEQCDGCHNISDDTIIF